ncbi:universal stress protein [Rubritalea tangerina]|uniref:Universal stress protein n=1 Tax=Rubritalea tangerina TaxID=430798 RepID=A0ABW4Z747_9BACT
MKTILAAIDFSKGTQRILQAASKLAAAFDEHVYLVHVIDDTPLYTMYGMYPEEIPAMAEYRELAVERAKQKMEEAKETLAGMGVAVVSEILDGQPQEAILEFAEKVQTDMVVVGTHGHSAIGSVLMGSVASSLVRQAKVPVLVVPID